MGKTTKDQAVLNFMVNTLNAIYPRHREYPFKELRIIEETDGELSEKWKNYPDFVITAYWMKRDIEIFSDNRFRF
jgi:hypothetical protein